MATAGATNAAMSGRYESPLHATTVELDHDLVFLFRAEAAKRDTTVPQLVRDLLEVIAADKLTTAILDDDAPPRAE
jgi:hypothetical protein